MRVSSNLLCCCIFLPADFTTILPLSGTTHNTESGLLAAGTAQQQQLKLMLLLTVVAGYILTGAKQF